MALKKILPNLDGLDENVAKLYKKSDDGKFHLDLEDDDGAELKRAKEHEVGLRKIAEQERDKAAGERDAALAKVTELTNAQGKDVQKLREELTADHNRQMSQKDDTHKKEVEGLQGAIKKTFVTGVAQSIAKDIAVDDGAAEILAEILQRRLTVEIVNGEPLTRVLGPDGKASTMTPDQLKAEYFTNEKFASIMRASDASGGGANGGDKKGGALNKKLSEMGDAERKKMVAEDPEGFKRLVAAQEAEDTAAARTQ